MTIELAIPILAGAGIGIFIQALLDRRVIRAARTLAFDEGRIAERIRELGVRR